MALVARMRAAAIDVLASLGEAERAAAVADFGVADRRDWTYLPGTRPGAMLGDLSEHTRGSVMQLLDAGLSAAGAQTARDVMELDGVLREAEREAGRGGWERRDPLRYWFRLLGDPAGEVWAWHLAGHHLAVHVTVVGDQVAATPQFFGANPAVVQSGPRRGWQVLREEEALARDLLSTLGPEQLGVAVVSPRAPADIATRDDPVADPAVVPAGVAWADLDRSQQARLERLIRCYLGRVADEVGSSAWRAVVDAGTAGLTFAWAGSRRPGEPHYYAVKAPTFLVEYDNTQDGANHAHTVWRDLRRDWGSDLLAEHHRAAH